MTTPPDQMDRDELEAEVADLRERIKRLESLFGTIGDASLDEAAAEDLLLAGQPVFRSLNQREKEIRSIESYLFGESLGSVTAIQEHINHVGTLHEEFSGTANSDVSGDEDEHAREAMLPVHRIWSDLQQGREVGISDTSPIRAAALFGQLVKAASGEPCAAVDASGSKYYTIQAPDAKQPLVEHDDGLDRAYPETVKRAFIALQRLTKAEDCDCAGIETCDHGLVVAKLDGGTNKAIAEKDRLTAYLKTIQTAVETDDGDDTAADDPGSSGEALDVDDELDRLEKATRETAVKDNGVVSTVGGDRVRSTARADGGDSTG